MGMGGQRHTRSLYPRERPGADCVGGGLGWLKGRSGRVRKISTLIGIRPQIVQPVAGRYTD